MRPATRRRSSSRSSPSASRSRRDPTLVRRGARPRRSCRPGGAPDRPRAPEGRDALLHRHEPKVPGGVASAARAGVEPDPVVADDEVDATVDALEEHIRVARARVLAHVDERLAGDTVDGRLISCAMWSPLRVTRTEHSIPDPLRTVCAQSVSATGSPRSSTCGRRSLMTCRSDTIGRDVAPNLLEQR